MFYSQTTNGFYDESLHGSRKLSIADPAWVRPQIEVPDPAFDPTAHTDGTPVPLILIDDPDAIQATIVVDNPACKIPGDAVEITDAEHAALLAAQTAGKVIQGDATGRPVAVDPPAPTADQMWDKIKTERDLRKSGGFKVVVAGVDTWFHSDEPSRSQYGVLLTTAIEKALPVDFVFDPAWKCMDGTKLPMTVALVRQIRDAGLVVEAQNFNNAELHRAAMEASADPSAYDFSAGWHQIYAESLVQV